MRLPGSYLKGNRRGAVNYSTDFKSIRSDVSAPEWHDYEGPAIDTDERERIVRDLLAATEKSSGYPPHWH
jgi:hypothetical protein